MGVDGGDVATITHNPFPARPATLPPPVVRCAPTGLTTPSNRILPPSIARFPMPPHRHHTLPLSPTCNPHANPTSPIHHPSNRWTTHCPNPIIQPSPNIVNTRGAAKQETIKTSKTSFKANKHTTKTSLYQTKRLLPAIKTDTTQKRGKSRPFKIWPGEFKQSVK